MRVVHPCANVPVQTMRVCDGSLDELMLIVSSEDAIAISFNGGKDCESP